MIGSDSTTNPRTPPGFAGWVGGVDDTINYNNTIKLNTTIFKYSMGVLYKAIT